MCGICGKLNFDRNESVAPRLLQQMMDLLQHRGPDGSGEFLSGPIALGHRRLSIIDVKSGNQPMTNEDGRIWLVYNGEIYNFRELRRDLQSRGHSFKSNSDTEVIVHLYEDLGDNCVTRLQGMFAFALWDAKRQHLLLARDRVGIKPLYVANTGRALLFASEAKSLLADPSVSRALNSGAVDRFLTYFYLPGTATLFEGIEKLAAGHYLTVDDGSIAVHRYWDLQPQALPSYRRFGDATAALRSLLSQSVKDHMISDVPLGVLISGGVDSTAVLRYATEHAGSKLRTFTVGFDEPRFEDERKLAQAVSTRFGTLHQAITITPSEFRDLLPTYVWHMEEPVCEPPAIALLLVSRLARQSVKVLLSGEGGDEAFGGYPEYRNYLLLERLKAAFGPCRPLLRLVFAGLARAGVRRMRRYATLVRMPLHDYYLSRTATPDSPFNHLKPILYTRHFADSIAPFGGSDTVTRDMFAHVSSQPLLNRMLYVDTMSWLVDDLLVKADKMTMAASVELRVPLLDFRVLEFAAALPPSFKVSGFSTKRVLKAALDHRVPAEVIRRRKAGFPVPYDRWMRSHLREFVIDTLLSTDAHLRAFLSPRVVRSLIAAQQRGEGYAKEVFSLLVFELWCRQFANVRAKTS